VNLSGASGDQTDRAVVVLLSDATKRGDSDANCARIGEDGLDCLRGRSVLNHQSDSAGSSGRNWKKLCGGGGDGYIRVDIALDKGSLVSDIFAHISKNR